MAIDQDVVSSGEFNVMLDYLRGAGASLGGPHLTGVYGEADVLDRAREAGVAAWYWQTVAWSGGRRTAAHLFQHVGTVNVGGVGCDVNDVLFPDWGQHNLEVDDVSWTDTLRDWDSPNAEAAAYVWLIAARKDAGAARALAEAQSGQIAELSSQVAALAGALTDSEAKIIAAIRGQAGQTNVDNLSTQLATALGPATTAELGRRLSASGNSTTPAGD
jgi:hypothetical protein